MKQQLHFKVKSSSQCCQSDRCIYMMLHGQAYYYDEMLLFAHFMELLGEGEICSI